MSAWTYVANTTVRIWTGCSPAVIPGAGGEVLIYSGTAQQLRPVVYGNITTSGGVLFQRFVIPFLPGIVLCDEVAFDPVTGKCCFLEQQVNVGALITNAFYQIMDCSPHQAGASPPGLSWNPDVWFLYAQLLPCR